MNISFENTAVAFAYKTTRQLKDSAFLFKTMGNEWLVRLGLKLTPAIMHMGFLFRRLIKKTIFKQFVGGETLEETSLVVDKLSQFNVKVILDYGVEGKESEDSFEHATEQFIRVIKYAASQPNIPFISVKLTGFARFGLLEKLHFSASHKLVLNGIVSTEALTPEEIREWQRVEDRLERICETAKKSNTAVLIDAEESWIQAPVDALTMNMMKKFNSEKVFVYNTFQLYRHDRLGFLKESIAISKEQNFLPGVKLVRGAYMEKERKRANDLAYPSPIHPDKEHTDQAYNLAVKFCIENLADLYAILASHNEYSNLYAVELLESFHLSFDHAHIHFSQLYGMSDNITFNLAKAGCSVSKYLPFGPIREVIPYLMRRARENSSVSGQTNKELDLVRKELRRRVPGSSSS